MNYAKFLVTSGKVHAAIKQWHVDLLAQRNEINTFTKAMGAKRYVADSRGVHALEFDKKPEGWCVYDRRLGNAYRPMISGKWKKANAEIVGKLKALKLNDADVLAELLGVHRLIFDGMRVSRIQAEIFEDGTTYIIHVPDCKEGWKNWNKVKDDGCRELLTSEYQDMKKEGGVK